MNNNILLSRITYLFMLNTLEQVFIIEVYIYIYIGFKVHEKFLNK